MKTDVNGCSTTLAGQEQYEQYYSHLMHAWRYQYDYRTPEGKLFSTTALSLEKCREKRDAWLKQQEAPND